MIRILRWIGLITGPLLVVAVLVSAVVAAPPPTLSMASPRQTTPATPAVLKLASAGADAPPGGVSGASANDSFAPAGVDCSATKSQVSYTWHVGISPSHMEHSMYVDVVQGICGHDHIGVTCTEGCGENRSVSIWTTPSVHAAIDWREYFVAGLFSVNPGASLPAVAPHWQAVGYEPGGYHMDLKWGDIVGASVWFVGDGGVWVSDFPYMAAIS